MTTFRFASAPGSIATFIARRQVETAILDYGDAMRLLDASDERALQERVVETRWDAVQRALDALEDVV